MLLSLKNSLFKGNKVKANFEDALIKIYYLKEDDVKLSKENSHLETLKKEIFKKSLLDNILDVKIVVRFYSRQNIYNAKENIVYLSEFNKDFKTALNNLVYFQLLKFLQKKYKRFFDEYEKRNLKALTKIITDKVL